MSRRIQRVNSLLREVLSEVIRHEVGNTGVHPMTTISRVETASDLHQAKVYVSILADDKARKETLAALASASGFISSIASKQVSLRFFPSLTFLLDTTVDKQQEIEELVQKIQQERTDR